MTYATSNPPVCLVPSIGGHPALWVYKDGDDDATVNGTDYITDALELGMKAGDFVLVYDTTTPKGSVHYVSAIDADGNGTLAFAAVA